MTVSEQIIQVINDLCEKLGIAINWTDQNIISYIEILAQKLIKYEIITSVLWMLFWILLSTVSIILIKKFRPIIKEKIDSEWDDGWLEVAFLTVGLIALYLATIGIICNETKDIIQCLVFPEMYLFEYVSTLIGK